MKVFVQIPCYNEERTLPAVLKDIPRRIAGVDQLEVMIIDDGSTDQTVAVAKAHGVKHIVSRTHMGLARSFKDGVNYALEHGADIVVNTDGDNQYPQAMIPELIKPILDGQAEIVIGDRQTHTIEHFSPLKKRLQRLGSWIVNKAAGTRLPDAASGFRAYSKTALLQLNVVTQFSYCMETIIQAGNKQLAITSIPITTNAKTRESRLFKTMREHVYKSTMAIVRSFIMYKPYVIFTWLSVVFLVVGLIPFIVYAVMALLPGPQGNHIQSLLVGAVLIIVAVLSMLIGIVADLNRINRILLEDSLEHIKRQRYRQTPK